MYNVILWSGIGRGAYSLAMEENDMRKRCSNYSKAHRVCHGIENAQMQLTVIFIRSQVQGQVGGENSVDVIPSAIIRKCEAREDWKLPGVV